jgi:hypothetical protein
MQDSETWQARAKARAQDWRTIGERLRNQNSRDRMLEVAAAYERMALIAAELDLRQRGSAAPPCDHHAV